MLIDGQTFMANRLITLVNLMQIFVYFHPSIYKPFINLFYIYFQRFLITVFNFDYFEEKLFILTILNMNVMNISLKEYDLKTSINPLILKIFDSILATNLILNILNIYIDFRLFFSLVFGIYLKKRFMKIFSDMIFKIF